MSDTNQPKPHLLCRIFGHDMEAIYDETTAPVDMDKLLPVIQELYHDSDKVEAIAAAMPTKSKYRGHVCTRCAHAIILIDANASES